MFSETGRDATEAFEDVGHSEEARSILDKYYVGLGPEVSPGSTPALLSLLVCTVSICGSS